MVDFVSKKLQVFVSSTFTDLRQERQAAVEAVLVAGHIPAGMELFTSGDESQMDVIKQWIDESDVYVLILGARYGSVEPRSEKSYTRLEYEYALAKDKPLFACVVTDAAIEARVRVHGSAAIETNNPAGLKEFRALVLSRMVRFWDDYKDIKIAIGETLSLFARRDDLRGWVRPASTPVDINALADEIARLSKENSQLRDRLASSRSGPHIQGFTFEELRELLERKEILDYLYDNRDALLDSDGMKDADRWKCDELAFLGLVDTPSHNMYGYTLTESGRIFLARLELEYFRANDDNGANT